MLLASSLPNATVIVSENRIEAILKAKELKCKVVFLDDGYGKHEIFKFDILLRPKDEPTNIFCLPSGGYRDSKMMYSFADCVLKEDVDFKRIVTFKNHENLIIETLPKNTILVTAISKPYRLLEYLPQNIEMVSFPDHYTFTQKDIDTILDKFPFSMIITTAKDMVKLKEFDIHEKLLLMDLEVSVAEEVKEKVNTYIDNLV